MATAREYREAIARFAEMRFIDVWYTRLDVATILKQLGSSASSKQMKRFQTDVAKLHTKDSMRALTKLCRTVDGELRIVGNPPLVTPIEDVLPHAEKDHLEDVVRRMISTYTRTVPRDRRKLLERFTYVHAARKVVSVGSVGTRAWILLLVGRDNNDPLFLQFKEAQASVLEPFLGKTQFTEHGQRVVEGQRMMQATADILLGWGTNRDHRRGRTGLLHPATLGCQGLDGRRDDELAHAGGLRQDLRLDARKSPRAFGRHDRDRRLSRQQRLLRPRYGLIFRGVRRPKRARLQHAKRGESVRPRRRRDGRSIGRTSDGGLQTVVSASDHPAPRRRRERAAGAARSLVDASQPPS
jgi:hypothetical protein